MKLILELLSTLLGFIGAQLQIEAILDWEQHFLYVKVSL